MPGFFFYTKYVAECEQSKRPATMPAFGYFEYLLVDEGAGGGLCEVEYAGRHHTEVDRGNHANGER